MSKVLIVDDKDANRYVLINFLKLFGTNAQIEIHEASSGKEAIAKIQEIKPDLVLMDIKMETEDAGIEAVKMIRSNDSIAQTQVWAITAQAMESDNIEEGDKAKCLRAGFNDYVSKPFDPSDLLVKFSSYLDIEIPSPIREKMGIS